MFGTCFLEQGTLISAPVIGLMTFKIKNKWLVPEKVSNDYKIYVVDAKASESLVEYLGKLMIKIYHFI